MKPVLPSLLIGTLASGCDVRIDEVPCTYDDMEFHAAVVNDFFDANFREILRSRFSEVGLDHILRPDDLALEGAALDLHCATSIWDTIHHEPGKMAVTPYKDIFWVDIDDPTYVQGLDYFTSFMDSDDSYDRYYAVNSVIATAAHEIGHSLFPDITHSDETRAVVNGVTEFTWGPCKGWTGVAKKTDDLTYDLQAAVTCAYADYGDWLFD